MLAIIGIVLLVLVLLMLVRLGGMVEYSADGLLVQMKIGPLFLTVWPIKPKKQKKSRPPRQKKQRKPAGGNRLPKSGSFALIKQFLPLITEAAGHLLHRIRIDQFYLDLTVAAPDPDRAALFFGGANAAVGMIWPFVEQNFNVKERRIRTNVDFTAQTSMVHLKAVFTLTIGQLLHLSIRLTVKFLRLFFACRNTNPPEQKAGTTQKEAV